MIQRSIANTVCCLKKKVAELEGRQLQLTMQPVYDTMTLWVEESGQVDANSAEWSWANGATGVIGVPTSEGWEITDIGFHANVFKTTSTVTVNVHDFSSGSTAAATILTGISLNGALDGGGQVDNASKYVTLATPVPVPTGAVIGFRTGAKTGNISNARVIIRLRKQIGTSVANVGLV